MSKIHFNHISRIVCACSKGRLALTLALALVALFATVGVLAKDYSSITDSNTAIGAKNSVLSLSSLPSRIKRLKKRLFSHKSSKDKASPETATPQPLQGTADGCVSEASGFKAVCTANDVALTDIVPGSVNILDDGCNGDPNDTVTFTAQGIYELTANERFDIGTFISTDGDPNGDGSKSGTCTRFSIASTPDPPYVNLDGDTCGDIDDAHSPLTQAVATPLGPVTIACVDNDDDGKVDLIHCETWNQPGADITCSSSADIKAGAPSKCNCGSLPSFCIAVPDDNQCTRDVCAGTCSTSGDFCENNADCDTGETCENITLQHIPQTGQSCGPAPSGVCDAQDICNAQGECVATFAPSTTTCRPSAGQCDSAESCTGSSAACPADQFAPATTTCVGTSNGGPCDGTDSCSGTANTCVDGFQSSTTVCRASAGQCDVAENCTGNSGACPTDQFAPSTTACTGTSNGGPCDGTDSCNGAGACVDGFQPSTTICRPAATQCDIPESCTSAGVCPADVNPACPTDTQIAPTATTCQDYTSGTAADLEELLYGLKGGAINSISPGVLFLYDTVHLDAACSTITVTQTDGPWEPRFIGVHQSQVVLYSLSCNKLNVGTVSVATGDVTITGVPPGDYVLGIKYDPTTLKGFTPPGGSPSATFTFAVSTCGTGSGSDSIDVNPKP